MLVGKPLLVESYPAVMITSWVDAVCRWRVEKESCLARQARLQLVILRWSMPAGALGSCWSHVRETLDGGEKTESAHVRMV